MESDEEDEDQDEGTHAQKPKEGAPRPSKTRRSSSPAGEQGFVVTRADLPFLIRKLDHLNINDKYVPYPRVTSYMRLHKAYMHLFDLYRHEKRKASGVYDFYNKCLNMYRETGAFVNIEASYMRGSALAANDWTFDLAER